MTKRELTALEDDLLDLVAEMFPHTAYRSVHSEARTMLIDHNRDWECVCEECEDALLRMHNEGPDEWPT
jgi:hypothetical protein